MPATPTQQQPVQSARGFYAAQTEQIRCDQCAGGEYQTSGGQSSCITCATGTYRERSAKPSAACTACPEGWINTGTGSVLCYASRLDHTTAAATTKSFSVKLGSDAVVLLLVAMPVVRVSMLQALVPFSVWIAYQASTKMILEEANALTARAVGFQ